MKLVLFTDKIGRIIAGEESDSQDTGHLVVKNPVICNLVTSDSTKPAQLSILPYCFIELFDLTKHNDYEVAFNNADVTMITSIGGGDTNNLHANIISNYTSLFDRIRNFKNQQVAPQPSDSNVVEVK